LGVRVIKFYTDVWYVMNHTPEDLFGDLGRCYDLISHLHPGILALGPEPQKAAVFCSHPPTAAEPPPVAPAPTPPARFVAAIHPGSTRRIVWWAECARAGLDLDFIETVHSRTAELSDLDYANALSGHQLSVNFTLRPGGARIATGRLFETALAGGVPVEEN